MDSSFHAIYEHGLLRPLEPLELQEDEVVSLAFVRGEENGDGVPPVDQERAIRQREILLAFVEKMESIPDDNPQDGFSNRDHDRLIYGP